MPIRNEVEIMTGLEIIGSLFDLLERLPSPGLLPDKERIKEEFLRFGFARVAITTDGSSSLKHFTIRGIVGTSGCQSADDLIMKAAHIALAFHFPSLAKEGLFSVYPDGQFRIIV